MRIFPALGTLLLASCIFGQATAAETPLYSQESESAYSAGQARQRANDLAGAQTELEKAAGMFPSNTKYLLAIGLVYLRTGQGQWAAQTYSRACPLIEAEYGSLSSRLQACHTLWGNALAMVQDRAGALEKFRSAYNITLTQKPRSIVDCLMSLYSLTSALNASGRGKEAVELYEQLLSETPLSSPHRPEIEEALRKVRDGQMPPRMM
jgi:tetratricopeptide (TPR) repeat protein